MESLIPLLLIFAVLMLPMLWMSSRQRKAQQKHLERVRQLGVGDEVRTHSGFFGLIVEAFDDVVILESEDGSQSKWARQAIAEQIGGEELATEADETVEGELAAEDPAEGTAAEPRRAEGDVPGVTVDDSTSSDGIRRDRD